ncbi:MAG: protein translocase subunit SecDF [Bacteroidia bacterium]|jgi:SecD/SecF fusion protein|nr:protein translocase subunit SecDF [Bacteroidia bacterium]
MQNIKGAIRIFAILMALSCIFYLSFTFVTRSWEKKADAYANDYLSSKNVKDLVATANGNKQLEKHLLDSVKDARTRFFLEDSILGKKIYLWYFTYQQCKEKELSLGLDLQGGMNVTLEVSTPEIVSALANNPDDPAFKQAMLLALERQKNSTQDFVTLFGAAYAEKNPQGRLSSFFAASLKDENITYNSSNEQVLSELREQANSAVDQAKLVLETRINKFGVSQPNIQKLEASNRILVELPGVKDKARVRKLIVGSANLEFWETYDMKDLIQPLTQANERLKVIMGITDSTKVDSAAYTPDFSKAKTAADSASAREVAQKLGDSVKKADSIKLAADTTKKKNERQPLFERFQPNQSQDGKGPVVGFAAQKDTAYVMSLFRNPEVKRIMPSDLRLAWNFKAETSENGGSPFFTLIALKAGRNGRAAMQGDVITNARKQTTPGSANYEISMTMNAAGSSEWARITRLNVGRSIAIVLDNNVYSYPNVNQEINGGVSQITGQFSSQDADDLVNVLNTGRLPAKARIVEETVVGPSLGKEAVRSGLLSFVVALLVVLLYMGFYYNRAGWVASIALFVNVFFIMGVLASLGAVLTLPGIAGVILTIALSVDANILIFERIREELREGKGLALAISDGYKHAMSSILDSNLTTLILGIILYSFGTGPVQGFATTLIIGILSSLFCAIFITRMIFDAMLKRDAKINFSIPATEHVLLGKNFDFVGKRRIFYMISGAIIALGVVFFFKNDGFRLGVDFSGGRTFTVSFNNEVNTDAVRQALTPEFGGTTPEVKTAGGNNQLKITTNFMSTDVSDKADTIVNEKLRNGLTKAAGGADKYIVEGSSQVGPSIAKDVVNRSYVVIIASCVLMFLFILFRFRKWQFGLGAVAALLHDVLVVLSFFVIFEGIVPFPLEIDQHFVAAILTVMAYSMTDTVVVFDRIREFLTGKGNQMQGAEQRRLINYALNSTLSRTINTSMITFFVLLAIFIFGGDTIRGFAFALVIGIVIGTYSSLCIATPVVVDFDRSKDTGEATKA